MSIPELGRRNSVSFSTPVKQGSSVLYLLGCAEEPSVEELSGGTGREWRRAVGWHWDSVEELSGGTEAVRGDLTTELHLH